MRISKRGHEARVIEVECASLEKRGEAREGVGGLGNT